MKRRFLSGLISLIMIFAFFSCAPVNIEDTGERISGTYVWSISIGVSMESTWSFDEDTVTNRFYNGLDYVEQTYTYVIGIDNGVKVIRLTPIDGYGVIEYEFDYGTGYVMIQGERYETPEE